MLYKILLLLIAAMATMVSVPHSGAEQSNTLRDPASFSQIANRSERSRALFTEAGKVLTHPRCMNCHPADDSPTQGSDMKPHSPRTTRGVGGFGIAGNTCQACHTEANYTLIERASYKSIPGHPRWGLAPLEMAWQGKSLSQICAQLKDPKRNGNRSLELVHEHMANDDLVSWGWNPGAGRDPAPGNQKLFGDLIQAWIETGAECP